MIEVPRADRGASDGRSRSSAAPESREPSLRAPEQRPSRFSGPGGRPVREPAPSAAPSAPARGASPENGSLWYERRAGSNGGARPRELEMPGERSERVLEWPSARRTPAFPDAYRGENQGPRPRGDVTRRGPGARLGYTLGEAQRPIGPGSSRLAPERAPQRGSLAAPRPQAALDPRERAPSLSRVQPQRAPSTGKLATGGSSGSRASAHPAPALSALRSRAGATPDAPQLAAVKQARNAAPAREQAMEGLRSLAAANPARASALASAGAALARAQGAAVGAAVSGVAGLHAGAAIAKCYEPPPLYTNCPGGYWYPWGLGISYFDNNFGLSLGWGWGWSGHCGWGWGGPWWGSPKWCWPWASPWAYAWYGYCQPWYAYSSPAVVYTTVIYEEVERYDEDDTVVIVDQRDEARDVRGAAGARADDSEWVEADANAGAELLRGEAALLPRSAGVGGTAPVNSVAQRYVELGDTAFRAGRWSEAVQLYAHALEQQPGVGVLHLVLADALFATGDYHYAAFSLRRAFALDPALASAAIDKRSFYSDPLEFDRQLARLETYVKEHPEDADARLVLAANELFGGRPQAAVQRLDGPGAAQGALDGATRTVLEAARRAQVGAQTPR